MIGSIPHDWVGMGAAGGAVFLFVYIGVVLFRRGWAGYEERYVAGAEKTLDAMYLTMPRQHILYLALLSAFLFGAVLFLLTGQPLLSIPLGLTGLGLPLVILWYLKRKRDLLFGVQLVDALMNVSNSLKAGMTLPQAFDVLSREMPNPMSQEMRLVVRELRLGVELEDALAHLYQRMPSPDVDLVVTAIGITRDVGGNLTEVFDNIAHTIRERFRIEGKIRALTSQGKAQAAIICCMPVAVGLALHYLSPGVVESLFVDWRGAAILLVAFLLEAFGIYIIYRIVNIDI